MLTLRDEVDSTLFIILKYELFLELLPNRTKEKKIVIANSSTISTSTFDYHLPLSQPSHPTPTTTYFLISM